MRGMEEEERGRGKERGTKKKLGVSGSRKI
jgi:hypothetical protein